MLGVILDFCGQKEIFWNEYFQNTLKNDFIDTDDLNQQLVRLGVLQGEAYASWCRWHCDDWRRTGVGWAEATTGSWAESRSRVYIVSLKDASSAAGSSAFPGLSSPGRAQNGVFQHQTRAEWKENNEWPSKVLPSTPLTFDALTNISFRVLSSHLSPTAWFCIFPAWEGVELFKICDFANKVAWLNGVINQNHVP